MVGAFRPSRSGTGKEQHGRPASWWISCLSCASSTRLGEQFEDEEHRILGEGGFEKAVAEVAQMKQTLGIFDLAKFTPK